MQGLILEKMVCEACDAVVPLGEYIQRLSVRIELYEKMMDASPDLDE